MSAYEKDVTKVQHFILKSKIKGMAAMGVDIRCKIQKKKETLPPDKRYRLEGMRNTKIGVGSYQRHHLIAYGLLRGLPYERIESKVGKNNGASAVMVHGIILEHVNPYRQKEWTLERVQNLMDRSASKQAAA